MNLVDPTEVLQRWRRTKWVPPRRLDRLEDLAQAWQGAIARAAMDGNEAGGRRANLSALRSLLDSFATLSGFRADVPQLCAEIERQRVEIERLKHDLECAKEDLRDARREARETEREMMHMRTTAEERQ